MPRFSLSIRAALSLLVLGSLALTAHILGLLAYSSYETSMRELAQVISLRVGSATRSRLQAHLDVGTRVLDELEVLASRKLFPLDEPTELGLRLALRLSVEPSLDELCYGDSAGRFTGASRASGPISIRRWKLTGPALSEGSEEALDASGQVTSRRESVQSYDPRSRSWYRDAVAGRSWTDVQPWFLGGQGISCLRKITTDQGELRGVLTADFRLNALTSFLDSLRVGQSGEVFLLDGQGKVLVSPSERPSSELARRVVESFLAPGSTTLSGTEAVSHRYLYQDQAYLLDLQYFEVAGLRWASAVVIPEVEFLGRAQEAARASAWIALSALALTFALGSWLAKRLASPLQGLANELESVARMDFCETERRPSRISELQVVDEAVARMKASLRSFERYVPKDLVADLMSHGQIARLGGEPRILTIHFSDIAGFTSLSEPLSPQAVVELLAEYLSEMGEVLDQHEGTIDKFMGDGILAFFNAPRRFEDHALRACLAALDAQERLARLRAAWEPQGRPLIYSRIGLHTGEVLVGNIGTPDRFAYTVIGDSVNLAARLESLNKVYGSSIMASEMTVRAAGESLIWRRLDNVAVVGRREGVLVYELLGRAATLDATQLERARSYESALEHYFHGQFSEALKRFSSLEPEDKAAAALAARCREHIANPPEIWDGIFRPDSK